MRFPPAVERAQRSDGGNETGLYGERHGAPRCWTSSFWKVRRL